MPIKYEGVAVFVADMVRSRKFYEELLGQKVLADYGPNLVFEGGFSLWLAEHANEIIHGGKGADPAPLGRGNMELYFETADLERACQALAQAGAPQVNPLTEQPWGQLSARFTDPDGHLVELAEPLPALVRRLLGQGLSLEQTAARTSMPLEMVRSMAEAPE